MRRNRLAKQLFTFVVAVLLTVGSMAAECKSDPHQSDPKKDNNKGYSVHEGGACPKEGVIAQKNGRQYVCKIGVGHRLRWRFADPPDTPDAPKRKK